MSTYIESPMLGRSRVPDDAERAAVAETVADMPVAVFQELNKAFNARGLMLHIDVARPAQ